MMDYSNAQSFKAAKSSLLLAHCEGYAIPPGGSHFKASIPQYASYQGF